ncbi:hypothetical protein [Alteromonas halophila]|uniref:hypothetical protein n=1 Tax=Alteromonas halophila TaxID=516698 RepID=UPI001675D9B5|nr:hypothetical protein [Alteromonas halophila]
MSAIRKLSILYSFMGFVVSVILVAIFDHFPDIRFLSDEAIIFGVMTATMHAAMNKAATITSSGHTAE